MDHCQNGCPCEDFDCDLALNVTDPVYGLESIGVMESVGEFHNRYNVFDLKKHYFRSDFQRRMCRYDK